MSRVPHPLAVQRAVHRMKRFNSLTYTTEFQDSLMATFIHSLQAPKLELVPPNIDRRALPVAIRLSPVIETPYLHGVIPATFYLTLIGVDEMHGTMIYDTNAFTYGISPWNRGHPLEFFFRPDTDEARLWLRRAIAKNVGLRYEETPFARMGGDSDDNNIVFTNG